MLPHKVSDAKALAEEKGSVRVGVLRLFTLWLSVLAVLTRDTPRLVLLTGLIVVSTVPSVARSAPRIG